MATASDGSVGMFPFPDPEVEVAVAELSARIAFVSLSLASLAHAATSDDDEVRAAARDGIRNLVERLAESVDGKMLPELRSLVGRMRLPDTHQLSKTIGLLETEVKTAVARVAVDDEPSATEAS